MEYHAVLFKHVKYDKKYILKNVHEAITVIRNKQH